MEKLQIFKGIPNGKQIPFIREEWEGIYVHVLCEDNEGQYVARNIAFDEAMENPAFAQNLVCAEYEHTQWHGNAYNGGVALVCKNPDFIIGTYAYSSTKFDGSVVWGGPGVESFGEPKGLCRQKYSVSLEGRGHTGF